MYSYNSLIRAPISSSVGFDTITWDEPEQEFTFRNVRSSRAHVVNDRSAQMSQVPEHGYCEMGLWNLESIGQPLSKVVLPQLIEHDETHVCQDNMVSTALSIACFSLSLCRYVLNDDTRVGRMPLSIGKNAKPDLPPVVI